MTDAPTLSWYKSSYSGGSSSDCVEVAQGANQLYIRDSKDPHGPALAFDAASFTDFLDDVKNNRFPG